MKLKDREIKKSLLCFCSIRKRNKNLLKNLRPEKEDKYSIGYGIINGVRITHCS